MRSTRIIALMVALLVCLGGSALATGDVANPTPPILDGNGRAILTPNAPLDIVIGKGAATPSGDAGQAPQGADLGIQNYGPKQVGAPGDGTALQVKIWPERSDPEHPYPFEIPEVTQWQQLDVLAPCAAGQPSNQAAQKLDFTPVFRSDVAAGYYPVKFYIQYTYGGDVYTTAQIIYFRVVNGQVEPQPTATQAPSAPPSGNTPDPTSDQPATDPGIVDPGIGGGGSGGGVSGSGSVPRVMITGFKTDPAEVKAGDTFRLTLLVTNTAAKVKVQNLKVALKGDEDGTFLPSSGSSSMYIKDIKANSTTELTIEMVAKNDLVPKPYPIAITIDYEDKDATQYNVAESVSIPVHQEPRLTLTDPTLMPEYGTVGQEINLMLNLYNMGKGKLYNVMAHVEGGEYLKCEDFFAGTMEPGATAAMDVMATPLMAGELSGKISVTFEDESGAQYTQSKDLILSISDPYIPSDDDFNTFDPEKEAIAAGQSHAKVWLWVGFGAVAAAGVVVAIVLLMRAKKKRSRLDDEIF
jgi:hypothetical protein